MSGVRTIETFVVESVKGIELPGEIPGCPLSLEARRLLLAHCPVYIVDPTAETEGYLTYDPRPATQAYDAASYHIWQAGPEHHRSFALGGPGLDTPWRDEHGNFYNSFTFKGVNFTKPGVMEHPVSTDGVVAWGLQESKVISRVLAASAVLVPRGVSTERIIGLAEPKEYPWPLIDGHTDAHTYIPLGLYKQRIVDRHWRQLPEQERTLDALADLTKKFGDMTFYISLRATDTAYRLADTCEPKTASEFAAELNQYHLSPGQKPFDLSDTDDHRRYVVDLFAPRAGKTLARAHEDLAHGFANDLNWTALAGIVDLDSVHGESLGLGDAPITNEDRAKDVFETLRAIHGVCPAPTTVQSELHPAAKDAALNFLDSYFDETLEVFGNSQQTIEHIGDVILCFGAVIDQKDIEFRKLNDQLIELASELYVERFYRDAYARELAADPDAKNIVQMLESDELIAEQLTKDIFNIINKQMIYYARMIVEENIGDLRDPKFDAVANFMHHTRRSYAWSQIVQDVAAELLLFSGIVTLDSPPECISTIKSPYLRALVAEVFAADHQSELTTWAEEIVTANLPNLEPKLRLLCDYERPPTLLSDCTSEPYTGLDAKRFVMSTHDVPFERIQAFMRTFSGDLHIEQLPLPQPEGAPGIHILVKKQDNVVEIISHSSIDALMVGLDEGAPVMEVQFDAGVTDYVLLVSRTAEGDNKLVLMVKDVAQFQKAEPEDGQALPFTQEALFV